MIFKMQEVKKPSKKPLVYYYLLTLAILLLLNATLFPSMNKNRIENVTYDVFMSMTDKKQIDQVEIRDDQILFTDKDGKIYETVATEDAGRTQRLYDSGAKFQQIDTQPSAMTSLLVNWILPLVPFMLIGYLLNRRMQKAMGGKDGMMFGMGGSSGAKVYVPSSTGIRFADVAGEDEAKELLGEIVDFLHDPEKYREIGAKLPKGALLVGPPGTGKTLLAKAVAGEANVPFFSIAGSEFVEMFVGRGAAKVRDLFKQANEKAPCIIFIDEIDTIGKKRDGQFSGGNDEREQTLNQLLTEMDGFDGSRGVVVLAATNRPDSLDPALLRPGRFDRQIYVGLPDIRGREAILKVHAKRKPLAEDVSLTQVAQATAGFTGADLANLLNEAALLAARQHSQFITAAHLHEAMLKVIAGPEKKSRVVTDHARRLTAYHEAGHAVVIHQLPTQDPVHQITIVPRGPAGGMTISLPTEDKAYLSKKELEERIAVCLGGRVAEELVLQDVSTGASSDIQKASEIARAMVTKYGMSEKLGAIAYGSESDEIFLGRSMAQARTYSEEVAAQIDQEVKDIVDRAHARCRDILTQHRHQLDITARYLLDHETMDAQTFDHVFTQPDDPELAGYQE